MSKIDWKLSNVLVTGGTGSFGSKFVELMLQEFHPKKLVVFSRDELKQHEMRCAGLNHPSLRYFIGDIRDVDRLKRAMKGIDYVVHAAALKQVPSCEYNPSEAILTNIIGPKNIIDAAIDNNVKRVIAISTDKAVNPVNLYGATKLVSEKLFIQGNAYSSEGNTTFSCVRYGNVVGSRGSVIPLFLKQRVDGILTVTDPRMTRFWLDLEDGVRFVIRSLEEMDRGEIFIPKIPSMSILELAKVIAPECKIKVTGIRPGEKLHEVLVSEEEGPNTYELSDKFIILPNQPQWTLTNHLGGTPVPEGFRYSSDSNPDWLDLAGIQAHIKKTETTHDTLWTPLLGRQRHTLSV